MLSPDALAVIVAALGGASVGLERQRSGKASGVNARFGGLRTFTLLGAIGGVAGVLAQRDLVVLAAILLAAGVGLIATAYVAASRRDIDATTEVAALVVVTAGVAAGVGALALASGIVAVTVFLLVEKPRLHAFASRVDDEEMRAAARFGVMALVILPLLPEGPYGPLGGVRPRQLWLLVLFFTALSFAGYIARRIVGARRGYPVAGLLGGLVSSTSVTLTFSRLSRSEPALAGPLAIGVIAACTTLFPRVALATAVFNQRVAVALLPYLALPFVLGVVSVIAGLRRGAAPAHETEAPRNPLQLGAALQMVAMFQIVLFIVAAARDRFGAAGLLATGAVLGLSDVDALTVSMTQAAATGVAPALAAKAIAVGILSNTVFKTALTLTLGTPRLWRVAGGVLAAMAILLLAAVFLR